MGGILRAVGAAAKVEGMRPVRPIAAATLALVLAACGSSSGGEPAAEAEHDHGSEGTVVATGPCRAAVDGTITLAASMLAFDTDCLEVPADAPFSIRFENLDAAPHGVMIEDADGAVVFDGGNVIDGSITYEVTALAAGDYPFHCHVHPEMQGVLRAVG